MLCYGCETTLTTTESKRAFQVKATRKKKKERKTKEGNSLLCQPPPTFPLENENVEKCQTIPGIGSVLMFTENSFLLLFKGQRQSFKEQILKASECL